MKSSTPRRSPKSTREYRDYDYADRLSPEDRAWLEKFDEEYYGGSIGASPLHNTDELRKSAHREKSRRNRDATGKWFRVEGAPDYPDVEDRDWSPREETEDYRVALRAFRAILPVDGRKIAPNTPEFRAAAKKLDVVAGVKTSRRMEGVSKIKMAKSRLERTKAEHRVVWHLGVTVSKCTFTGLESEAAVEMLSYLERRLASLEEKLKAMGTDPKTLSWVAGRGVPNE